MGIGDSKDFFISVMRFNFTVKYRCSEKCVFYFLNDKIEIFKWKKWEFKSIKFTIIKKIKFCSTCRGLLFFIKIVLFKTKAYNYRNKQSMISQKNYDNRQSKWL